MPKEVELELPCDLTEDEMRCKVQQVAAALAETDTVESAKADADKEFKRQLQELNERMRRLGKHVREKSEIRMVICTVEFNVPQIGVKRVTRKDTGELVREVPMTDEERQLHIFTLEPQPPASSPKKRDAHKKKGGAEGATDEK